MKIAIPSVLPGGLEAQVGAHFGHCDCYTLVDVEDGAVVKSEVIPSCAHEHGGCLAPVNYLADRGADSHRHARGRPLDGLRRRPQGRRPLL